MYLEIVDEEFKKAVREEIKNVISRDTKNENKEMVEEIAKETLRNLWSTHSEDFQKAFKRQFDGPFNSFGDNVLRAIKENARPLIDAVNADDIVSKYITDEAVGKAIEKYVRNYVDSRDATKRIEEVIAAKVQEIFVRKFMLQEINKQEVTNG